MPAQRGTLAAARSLLDGRKGAIAGMSVSSLAGGVMEAAFLVLVTRSAFAIAEGDRQVGITTGQVWATRSALVVALALVVARSGLAMLTNLQSARISNGVVAQVRADLARAYLRASWATQQAERSGKLQELLTTYATGATSMINGVVGVVTSGLNLVALLGIAFVVDPFGSLIVIAAVTALAMVLRPIRAAVKRQAARAATGGMGFATSLNEVSQLGLEVHVFHVQDQVQQRVDELIARNARIGQRLSFLKQLVPTLYTALAYLVLVGSLAIATLSDATDLTSLGAVMLVMMRSLSYGQVLQTNSANLNSSAPFVDTLEHELTRYRANVVHDDGLEVDHVGDMTLEAVCFEYVPNQPVLSDINGTIRERSVVGIVGPSGSGKSTLVQLLLGLRTPTSGRVMSAGREIAAFSRESWARKVTFVPQSSHLIAGTVADNIRFMRSGVSQADIEAAAKAAHLHDDIIAASDGYQRRIGESGGGLSGGQAQRLSIARALIERPDVMILDEPTSSLDVQSEALIRTTLSELSARMTIVVIAHRMSTLEVCDEIMVIQGGHLVAQGSPDVLEGSNKFYREALELSGLR